MQESSPLGIAPLLVEVVDWALVTRAAAAAITKYLKNILIGFMFVFGHASYNAQPWERSGPGQGQRPSNVICSMQPQAGAWPVTFSRNVKGDVALGDG